MSVLNDPKLERFLASLHARSAEQIATILASGAWQENADRSDEETASHRKKLVSDKLFALDREKARFCYQLCRATDARRIVEIGTSFGVSTIYLAAALRDNIAAHGGDGVVIGTEHELAKARMAREHFERVGLSHLIDLREGDLRQTLSNLDGSVDFVLMDIWPEVARPAIELVAHRLRKGAMVICDNTEAYREAYRDYFAFLNDHTNAFRTMTLPYAGGLELSVYLPQS